MIIIEGPDGAGKSTLIKQLRRKHDFMTVALGGPVKGVDGMTAALIMFNRLREMEGGWGLDVVADRHPTVSEPIYSKFMDRPNLLQGWYERGDDVIIYCRPQLSIIKQNLNSHPQLEGVVPRIAELVNAYDEFFGGVEHVLYNYMTMSTDSLGGYFSK